jgi:hypothetical protein
MIAFVTLTGLAVLHKKVGGAHHTRVHGYLMMAATLIGAFGGYVIYSNKEANNKPHLKSWHGLIGFIALVGYLVLAAVGFFFLSPEWGLLRTNKLIRQVHKLTGKLMIFLSWGGLMYKLTEIYADNLAIQAGFGLPLVVFAYFILL